MRPSDFDETTIRKSPTFIKWNNLREGDTLRYACRDFTKGYGEDEERLMRRIMIRRRHNVRDHETLKEARRCYIEAKDSTIIFHEEMDVPAVESTRSFRKWLLLK